MTLSTIYNTRISHTYTTSLQTGCSAYMLNTLYFIPMTIIDYILHAKKDHSPEFSFKKVTLFSSNLIVEIFPNNLARPHKCWTYLSKLFMVGIFLSAFSYLFEYSQICSSVTFSMHLIYKSSHCFTYNSIKWV